MKEYMKPDLEYIDFSTENITSDLDGDQGVGSSNETPPWAQG